MYVKIPNYSTAETRRFFAPHKRCVLRTSNETPHFWNKKFNRNVNSKNESLPKVCILFCINLNNKYPHFLETKICYIFARSKKFCLQNDNPATSKSALIYELLTLQYTRHLPETSCRLKSFVGVYQTSVSYFIKYLAGSLGYFECSRCLTSWTVVDLAAEEKKEEKKVSLVRIRSISSPGMWHVYTFIPVTCVALSISSPLTLARHRWFRATWQTTKTRQPMLFVHKIAPRDLYTITDLKKTQTKRTAKKPKSNILFNNSDGYSITLIFLKVQGCQFASIEYKHWFCEITPIWIILSVKKKCWKKINWLTKIKGLKKDKKCATRLENNYLVQLAEVIVRMAH